GGVPCPPVEPVGGAERIPDDAAQLGAALSIRSGRAVEGIGAGFARRQRGRSGAGASSSALPAGADAGAGLAIPAGVPRNAPVATRATDCGDDVPVHEAAVVRFRAAGARGEGYTAGRSVESVQARAAVRAIAAVKSAEPFVCDDVIA